MKKYSNKCKETINIREFLGYIARRQKYLKSFVGEDYPLTEIKYYEEFSKRINDWGKKHKLFYAYLLQKISLKEGANIIGGSEGTWNRFTSNQRSQFVRFLKETEKELDEKYQFIPFTGEDLIWGKENGRKETD